MIKHVDDFRPIHNLQSMRDLAAALSALGSRGQESRSKVAA
jgi:uncharacterized protein with von Willebrand factor type A (vWA) domain